MPTVVGKDSSVMKRAVCRQCASIVEYAPIEVKSVNGKDYSGGPDGYDFIDCPCCNSKIILRSW